MNEPPPPAYYIYRPWFMLRRPDAEKWGRSRGVWATTRAEARRLSDQRASANLPVDGWEVAVRVYVTDGVHITYDTPCWDWNGEGEA